MIAAGRFIAIIDKDRSVRRALGRLLQAHGFHPQAYASAEAYLLRGRTDEPACIVLDIELDVELDGMSGMELLDRLKADGSSIPLVVITAVGSEYTRRRAFEAGCVAYLQKPSSADLLLAAITKAVTADVKRSA
jgi:FixJ family two-component response regulator